MFTFLLISLWTMSMLFMMLNHPLSFGAILLIQTILTSLMAGMMTYNYWFSYILFLIMIGGMLVLFIYMTSIASNEKFKFKMTILYMIIMMIFISFNILLTDQYLMNLINFNYDMTSFFNLYNNNFNMNKFMNFPSINIMMILIIYLLISLIAIVKITEIQYGPMRQKF